MKEVSGSDPGIMIPAAVEAQKRKMLEHWYCHEEVDLDLAGGDGLLSAGNHMDVASFPFRSA